MMRIERRAAEWSVLIGLVSVACAAREVPSSWPEASAASPASPAAPVEVITHSLDEPPPLPGEVGEGWSGLGGPTAAADVAPEGQGERAAHEGHAEHQGHSQQGGPSGQHVLPATAPAAADAPAGSGDSDAVYTCPMHPDVVSKQPGKCPRCGMSLVKRDASK
jgi:hypothetical protein